MLKIQELRKSRTQGRVYSGYADADTSNRVGEGAKTEAEGSVLKYVTGSDHEVRAEPMSQATRQSVHFDTPL